MLTFPLIQVAGVIDPTEADMLQRCGVRYLGFPLRLAVHAEDLSEAHAARMIKKLAPPCYGVLITYLAEAHAIREFARELGARVVQLHGDVARDELRELRRIDPDLAVVKSLVVGRHTEDVLADTIERATPFVDAFITDTFDPTTGASGGTGKTHDWSVSRRLVQLSDRPVILAGGLTPSNVRRAILEVCPAGVDAHTGLEDAFGRKSPEKVARFVAEAIAAFAELRPSPRPPHQG